MERVLVVVTHPKPEAFIRSALDRVLKGLTASGVEVRLVDLDEEGFGPSPRPEEATDPLIAAASLAEHVDNLAWCTQLVLVYPTWFGGPPARMLGWFDRLWRPNVGLDASGRRKNIRRIDAVTTHGSPARINFLQGNGGRMMINRELRLRCHRLCRVGWNALYSLDRISYEERQNWLDEIEAAFGPAAIQPEP